MHFKRVLSALVHSGGDWTDDLVPCFTRWSICEWEHDQGGWSVEQMVLGFHYWQWLYDIGSVDSVYSSTVITVRQNASPALPAKTVSTFRGRHF